MTKLIDSEPSSFEEVFSQQMWVDSMVEEYNSIIKSNVWEVVPRIENKLVVGSRWLYKVQHATDGNVE